MSNPVILVDPCADHREEQCSRCNNTVCLICAEIRCVLCACLLCSDCSNRKIPPLNGFVNDEITKAHKFDCERACRTICRYCDNRTIASTVDDWNEVCGVDSLHWLLKNGATVKKILRNRITADLVEEIRTKHNFYTTNEHNLREKLSFDPTPFLNCNGNINSSATLAEAIMQPVKFIPTTVYANIIEKCYYFSLELQVPIYHYESSISEDALVLKPIPARVKPLFDLQMEKWEEMGRISDERERLWFEARYRAALKAQYPVLWPWKREPVVKLLKEFFTAKLYHPDGKLAKEVGERFTSAAIEADEKFALAAKRQAAPHESQRDPKRIITIE